MNILFKAALFALAILATSATTLAAPILRDSVTVSDRLVTVGDMFDDAGDMAELPLFRAPAPGTVGQVAISAIRAAASRAGLLDFENPGLSEITVARSGTMVSQEQLNELIATELQNRGNLPGSMSVSMNLAQPLGELTAADTDRPVTMTDLRYVSGADRFSARFMLAGTSAPLDINGSLQFTIEAPHLTHPMSSGEVITTGDIVMRPVAVDYADSTGSLTIEDTIGKQLNRQMREGIMVRPADISNPLVIARNDDVTLLLQSGAMTLTVRGQALNDASRGDSVSVLNLISNRVVRGIATNPGTVELRPSSTTMASL